MSPPARRKALRLVGGIAAAVMAGYLTAFLVVFPSPILPGYHPVPRVLGLTLEAAQAALQRSRLEPANAGSESHASAPRGTVIWQDPPAEVVAPEGSRVDLVLSDGPARLPVPDVAGLDGELAKRILRAAGLTLAAVESVQTAAPQGVVVVSRPPATTALSAGSGVTLVVSRGAPTVTVPQLLGMSLGDARARLEEAGLVLGVVSRRTSREGNPGTVQAQRPTGGTLAVPGSAVDVVLVRSP